MNKKTRSRNPTVLLRAIPNNATNGWDHYQLVESQSHRTAQGNSEKDSMFDSSRNGRKVAIPPYCSGQFRTRDQEGNGNLRNDLESRNPTVLLRAIPKRRPCRPDRGPGTSQSHRTAQGNSESSGR